MRSHGKFSLGVVFLLMVGPRLNAQWGPVPNNSQMDAMPSSGKCRDIVVLVADTAGAGITGAAVAADNNAFQLTTDDRGLVAIPCRSLNDMITVATVSAPGYFPRTFNLSRASLSRMEVRLDTRRPAVSSAGATVSAAELSPNIQKQSAQLQQDAGKALDARDYDNAEKLLLEAFHLTPSSASIANNLGLVAVHRKDLDSAGSWFRLASDEAPYRPEILGNLGLIRWMQHRTEESYTILARAFSAGYESTLGHYILGMLSLQKGESKSAADHLKKVPTDRFPYRDLYLSIALRNYGKTKAADESYRNFLRRNPVPLLISLLQ